MVYAWKVVMNIATFPFMKLQQFYIPTEMNKKCLFTSAAWYSTFLIFGNLVSLWCFVLSNELPIVLLILFSFTLWVCLLSPHSGTGAWDGLGPHPSPGLQVGGESPLGFGQGSRSWDCHLRTV